MFCSHALKVFRFFVRAFRFCLTALTTSLPVLQWRQKNSKFTSLEEINYHPGVAPKTRKNVCVECRRHRTISPSIFLVSLWFQQVSPLGKAYQIPYFVFLETHKR